MQIHSVVLLVSLYINNANVGIDSAMNISVFYNIAILCMWQVVSVFIGLCCVYNLCIWHLCIWYWHKNVSFTSNYLTTELAHSKLKNGLFSRVISCHDRSTQNCQNSCSKCVQRTWTQALRRCLSLAYVHCVCRHKRLDNDTFLASLSRFKKATVLCSRCAEAPSCRNAKNLT